MHRHSSAKQVSRHLQAPSLLPPPCASSNPRSFQFELSLSHVSLSCLPALIQLLELLPPLNFFFFIPVLSRLFISSSFPPCSIAELKGSSSACIPIPPGPHSTPTFTTLSGCLWARKTIWQMACASQPQEAS